MNDQQVKMMRSYRCFSEHPESRCQRSAEGYLINPEGVPNPGGWHCAECGERIASELREKCEEDWRFVRFENFDKATVSRPRKTRDEWQLHVDYGQGWEHEISEDTYKEIRQRRKEYRENAPQYPRKVVRRRVRLEAQP